MSSDDSWDDFEDEDPYDVGSDFEHEDDWEPHEDEEDGNDDDYGINICPACGENLDDDGCEITCPICGYYDRR